MQKISDFMTRNVQVVRPDESLQRAAQVVDELNVGSLPVCEGIVSLGDLAMRHQGHVAAALRCISDPSMPDRPAN